MLRPSGEFHDFPQGPSSQKALVKWASSLKPLLVDFCISFLTQELGILGLCLGQEKKLPRVVPSPEFCPHVFLLAYSPFPSLYPVSSTSPSQLPLLCR